MRCLAVTCRPREFLQGGGGARDGAGEPAGAGKVDQNPFGARTPAPLRGSRAKLDDETRLLSTLKLTLRQREIDFQVPKRTIEILNSAEPARRPSKPVLSSTSWRRSFSAWSLAWAWPCCSSISTPASHHRRRGNAPEAAGARGDPFAREPMHDVQDNPADAEPFRVLHTN